MVLSPLDHNQADLVRQDQSLLTPHSSGEAQDWLASGLDLLEAVPDGLEGGIRMQQAALALQQAMRCGSSPELMATRLRHAVIRKLSRARDLLKRV